MSFNFGNTSTTGLGATSTPAKRKFIKNLTHFSRLCLYCTRNKLYIYFVAAFGNFSFGATTSAAAPAFGAQAAPTAGFGAAPAFGANNNGKLFAYQVIRLSKCFIIAFGNTAQTAPSFGFGAATSISTAAPSFGFGTNSTFSTPSAAPSFGFSAAPTQTAALGTGTSFTGFGAQAAGRHFLFYSI